MARKRRTDCERSMTKFRRKCDRIIAEVNAHIERQMPFIRPDLYWIPSDSNPNILVRRDA